MLKDLYRDQDRVAHLLSGPLGAHAEGFARTERACGFARLTLHGHLRAVGHLNRWLARRRIFACELTEGVLDAFVRDRRRRRRPGRDCREILCRFLEYLRATGVAPPATQDKPAHPHDPLLREFSSYLVHTRGLSEWTVVRYLRCVRVFAQRRFPRSSISPGQLRATDIHASILEEAKRRGTAAAKGFVVALRSFLRWLQYRGDVEETLVDSIPAVVRWRLTGVPTFLEPAAVKRILHSCDRRTAMGRRDYAILLLLARLGLRAGEIVGLRLEDLDWQSGLLAVRRKGGRPDRLPMPPDVGRAIATYLRHGRPICAERRVFLCMRAPHRGLGHSSTVSSIVAAALHRADLTPPRRGAHLLRHTLASWLLRQGAPLSEIGQLLGHTQARSTEVYAKVDIAALRAVAQPWPGGH